jgi:hypothetical protein
MEKRLKTRAQYWAGKRPRATVRAVVACHTRSANHPAGPQPGGPVQPRRHPAARERGTRWTHSWRGHHAVATHAAVGRRGWSVCSSGQGVLEKTA